MGRPRAKSGATKPPGRIPAKSRSANGTGILGGSGLVALAQVLPEPASKILIVFAPTISVVIAAWGPVVLDLVISGGYYAVDACKHHYAIHRLKGHARDRRRRLNDDLPTDRKAEIAEQIAEVERAIDDRKLRWVEPYLRGDTIAGVREGAADDSKSAENTQPPSVPGDVT